MPVALGEAGFTIQVPAMMRSIALMIRYTAGFRKQMMVRNKHMSQ